MACPSGHLACKECFFETILTQKQTHSRLQNLYKLQQDLMQQEMDARVEMLRQQEVDRFERTQVSVLGVSTQGGRGPAEVRVIEGTVFKGIKTAEGTIFVPDLSSIDPSERAKVFENMKELDKANAKPALPSFWVPSLTPDATPSAIEPLPAKLDLKCTGCDPPHSIASFKKLVKVNFTSAKKSANPAVSEDSADQQQPESDSKVCPSCVKTFNNGSKIMIIKRCGHAICKDCFSRFTKGSGKCHVCEGPCKTGDAFELFVEGTGFASSGGLDKMAKTVGVAFQ
ncbi:hypothetical protein HDU98_006272 [Podochytrium sp. JEL0797]|nr:hypothetical protein HDU98_006272 [Podochytrium sp. JEL0797]